jgi:hypothetical protein
MTERPNPAPHPDAPGRYEVRVTGRLDAHWAAWFDGLTVHQDADGTTVIGGQLADQSALHGLLQRVRDLGLPLISVTRVEPPPGDTADVPDTRHAITPSSKRRHS